MTEWNPDNLPAEVEGVYGGEQLAKVEWTPKDTQWAAYFSCVPLPTVGGPPGIPVKPAGDPRQTRRGSPSTSPEIPGPPHARGRASPKLKKKN